MIFKGVSRVFHESFKKTFKVFQESFMLHGTHRSFPSRRRACFTNISTIATPPTGGGRLPLNLTYSIQTKKLLANISFVVEVVEKYKLRHNRMKNNNILN